MIGPKSSRIETNIPSGSIPLFQASPQKIILQPQTAVQQPALQLTTAVLPPHREEPQLFAATNAPNQFPSQTNYPLIQQASGQLIQQPLNPIIQTSTNRPSININLDYGQEFAPSDIISINGIPYIRQDQIANRVLSSKTIFYGHDSCKLDFFCGLININCKLKNGLRCQFHQHFSGSFLVQK